jgi:hypothetical protein
MNPNVLLRVAVLLGFLQVQLNNEVALVKGGKVLRVLDGYASQGVYPTIDRIAPLCVSTKGPASVKLFGINLRSSNNVMIARCQGTFSPLPAHPLNFCSFLSPQFWEGGGHSVSVLRGFARTGGKGYAE